MADTVTIQLTNDGPKWVTAVLNCVSDGTGETDAVKIDLSTLSAGPDGSPTRLAVDEIQYDIAGFSSVTLEFDRGADQVIAVLSGQGALFFGDVGGLQDEGSGGTGDVVLTSNSAAAGASYTIVLSCRKKYN